MKKCPFCAEEISDELTVCPFCKKDLTETTPSKDIVENIETNNEGFNFPKASIFSYALSAVFVAIGFYKMWVYSNGEDYPYDSVNAYVGGDAYNYIINANYTVAYFILALTLVVLGSTFAIVKAITLKQQS